MEYKYQKIRSFTDLIAWKKAHELALSIYKITSNFPKRETYSLTDQMRRAAVSVPSNIAEGFSRRTKKGKDQFYYTSLGSLTELQSQLVLAKDLNYLNKETFQKTAKITIEISKLVNSLIKRPRNENT